MPHDVFAWRRLRVGPGMQAWALVLAGLVAAQAAAPAMDSAASTLSELMSSDLEWVPPLDAFGPDGGAFDTLGDRGDDLESWLSKVKFIIPDGTVQPVSISVSLGFLGHISVRLTVRRLVCDGLHVGKLGPPVAPAEAGAWGFEAAEVALSCLGSIDYASSGVLSLSGSADAKVSSSSAAFGGLLRFNSSDASEPRLPDALLLEACHSALSAQLQILGGSAWTQIAKLVPGVEAKLQDLLAHELDTVTCGDGARVALEFADGWLVHARARAQELLRTPAPPRPPRNASWIRWSELPEVQWAQQMQDIAGKQDLLDRMIRRFYPGGQVCVSGDVSPQAGAAPPGGLLAGSLGQCLLGKDPICLLGGTDDTRCVVRHSLHEDRPAILRVEAQHIALSADDPAVALLTESGENSVSLQGAANRSQLHMQLEINFTGWAGGVFAKDLGGNLSIEVALDRAELQAAVLLGFENESFFEVPAYMRYKSPGCLKDAARQLEVMDLVLGLALRNVSVALAPSMPTDTPNLVRGAVQLAEGLVQSLLGAYGTAASPLLQGLVRRDTLLAAQRRFQQEVDTTWYHGCPEQLGQETNSGKVKALINPTEAARFMMLACCLAGSAVLLGGLLVSRRSRPRINVPLSSLASVPGPQDARELGQSGVEQGGVSRWRHISRSRSALACCFKDSLFASKAVPRALSVSVPLMVVALGFFFLGSNYMELASTSINLQVAGLPGELRPSVPIFQVMVYSLFYSIKQLKRVQLSLLANVLLIFSGLLPYTKLILMFLAWTLPASLMPKRWRGRILLFLDQFGKYSLVDVFVVEFISAALATNIDMEKILAPPKPDAPAQPGGGDGGPEVLLRTSQSVGFASFVLATVGSLVVGHVCLYCHRDDTVAEDEGPAERRGSAGCIASDSSRGNSWLQRLCASLVGPLLALTSVLVVCGGFLEAFHVRLVTPLGELGQASYSFFGLAGGLPHFSPAPNALSTRFGQVTYVMFAIVIVLCHLLILSIFWLGKVPQRRLSTLATLARTLFAWSALDVVVLSMVITLLEMSTSNFLFLNGDQRARFEQLFGFPVGDHGLTVEVRLGLGTYLLGAAAVAHYWAGSMVMGRLDAAAAAVLHRQCTGPLDASEAASELESGAAAAAVAVAAAPWASPSLSPSPLAARPLRRGSIASSSGDCSLQEECSTLGLTEK